MFDVNVAGICSADRSSGGLPDIWKGTFPPPPNAHGKLCSELFHQHTPQASCFIHNPLHLYLDSGKLKIPISKQPMIRENFQKDSLDRHTELWSSPFNMTQRSSTTWRECSVSFQWAPESKLTPAHWITGKTRGQETPFWTFALDYVADLTIRKRRAWSQEALKLQLKKDIWYVPILINQMSLIWREP